MKKQILLCKKGDSAIVKDVGLLVLRIIVGVFMMTHGWAKLSSFSIMQDAFPAMLGMSSKVALSMIIFAEFFCSIALIFGVLTRLASIPLIIGMSVAAFMVHAADPFAVRELASLYLAIYVMFLITGAGRFSIDGLIRTYLARK